jgi:tripartite-type tricarboxylate transporter receptor subunit TctC
MKLTRTVFALALSCAAGLAMAQGYPTKPIKIIVPFQAGSAPDQIIRITTNHMAQTLGQAFVVDNKPGANGNIGVAEAARAAPDGYTIVSANNTTFAANPSLFKKLPFDPQKDFTPIGRLITTGLILSVRSDFPTKDLKAFIAYAKANPGKLSVAQASAGMQVSIAMLRSLAGVEMLEVPYKGQPQALNDLLGGAVNVTFADYAVGIPQIRAGKIIGLGVTTATRSQAAPEIPAIGEVVPGFDISVWAGMAAPAGTPRPIVDKLWQAAERALAAPEVHQALGKMSFNVEPMGPTEFAAYIRSETDKWAKIVKAAGIQPQ